MKFVIEITALQLSIWEDCVREPIHPQQMRQLLFDMKKNAKQVEEVVETTPEELAAELDKPATSSKKPATRRKRTPRATTKK